MISSMVSAGKKNDKKLRKKHVFFDEKTRCIFLSLAQAYLFPYHPPKKKEKEKKKNKKKRLI
jgi:hypothetical protein